ncbi:class I SAM-dependent DNA methyltransferase [Streptomyces sp. NBC_01304]|uniref:class I SAM-dependent DNA methyltransferase n=1 Tax=Streptomyces sp. NBC_01304 TaxID=2903818 RepID=UPI002E0D5944|nr:methyltransferase domain-containing protein [Streptomyces sp. NBC_01304]
MSPTRPSVTAVRQLSPYEQLAARYDALLGDRAFARLGRAYARIERHYGLAFRSAADVGCGTGTFVAQLRARGIHPVWGVDRSPHMLARALAKNRGNGARFLLQDLRTLRLPHQVDLLTCQFDTLNYLLRPPELHTALRAFARALPPGGHTVFDMIVRTGPGAAPLRRVRVERRGPQGTAYETHVQRAYRTEEITAALTGSGFHLRGAHPVPEGHPALRLVFVARKADTAVSPRSGRSPSPSWSPRSAPRPPSTPAPNGPSTH